MIQVNLKGKAVLVTGGTRGLGKAIGMEFSRAGASVLLTHRWGSADEPQLLEEFRAEGLHPARVQECDVSDPSQTRELMKSLKAAGEPLEVVVNNVSFAKVVHELGELKKNSLDLSLAYSAWPIVDALQASHEVLGRYPRYVLGISSDGAEVCHEGYEMAGISKAVMETLCRYLALRLKPEGVRINAVRPGFLDTASSRATFGDEVVDRAREKMEGLFLNPRVVAQACVALCSGLMDAVTGQVITVDEGWSLVSPLKFLGP